MSKTSRLFVPKVHFGEFDHIFCNRTPLNELTSMVGEMLVANITKR